MSFGSRPNFPVSGTVNFGDVDEYNRRISVGHGTVQVNGHDLDSSVVVDRPVVLTGEGYVFIERTKDDADAKYRKHKDADKADKNVDKANESSPVPSFTPEPAELHTAVVTDEDKKRVESKSSKK